MHDADHEESATLPAKKPRPPREWGTGTIRRLPSGRYQAQWREPDGKRTPAPVTFISRNDAVAWCTNQQTDRLRGVLGVVAPVDTAPSAPTPTLREYSDSWLAERTLRPRTRDHYRRLLDARILPGLGAVPITAIGPADLRTWHAGQVATGRPVMVRHAYALLRAILLTAHEDGHLASAPGRVRGAGATSPKRDLQPATPAQVAALAAAMPADLRLAVLLAGWCSLRFGEVSALRVGDLDTAAMTVRIERAASATPGAGVSVGPPKTRAGVRTIAYPPHLQPAVLAATADRPPGALLFRSHRSATTPISHSSFKDPWQVARVAAGLPDLRFHDLRHSGAVLAATSGATLADLMLRLGHTTPGVALRYQHAAAGRDRALADAMSKAAEDADHPLRP